MIAIPLGLITVPTAGTPVAISLNAQQLAQCGPGGQVFKVEVWADPGMTGVSVSVKQGGVVLAKLLKPASGCVPTWYTPEVGDNLLVPTAFSLDVATSGDGAFVTLWVA